MTDLSGEVSPLGGSNDRLKPVSPSRRSRETQPIQSNAHWNMGYRNNHFQVVDWKYGCLIGDRCGRAIDGKQMD
jgi:hypothetical protein